MKNNKLWFKAKMYGYGWTPASWEGWGVLALYIVSLIIHIRNIDMYASSASDVLISFLIPFIINTIFLLIICYVKGEEPRWRWGDK